MRFSTLSSTILRQVVQLVVPLYRSSSTAIAIEVSSTALYVK